MLPLKVGRLIITFNTLLPLLILKSIVFGHNVTHQLASFLNSVCKISASDQLDGAFSISQDELFASTQQQCFNAVQSYGSYLPVVRLKGFSFERCLSSEDCFRRFDWKSVTHLVKVKDCNEICLDWMITRMNATLRDLEFHYPVSSVGLVGILKQFTLLESLSLRSCMFGEEIQMMLDNDALNRLITLKLINPCQGSGLDDFDFGLLSHALGAKDCGIRNLELEGHSMTSKSLAFFAKFAYKLNSLKLARIPNMFKHVLLNGLSAFGRSLAAGSIESLTINSCNLMSFHTLFLFGQKLKSLRVLDLSHNLLTFYCWWHAIIPSVWHSVEVLDFSNNSFFVDSHEVMRVDRLPANLRYLSLAMNFLDNFAFAQLSILLPACVQLEEINFASNSLTSDDSAFNLLMDSIAALPSLSVLNMSDLVLGSRGAKVISSKRIRLDLLDLSNCRIGKRGLKYLSAALLPPRKRKKLFSFPCMSLPNDEERIALPPSPNLVVRRSLVLTGNEIPRKGQFPEVLIAT